ncbi:MAG: glycosyl transferase family 25 [Ferruginibacter sp.]|uniref:glycosyltransferase family 25 protein n=1 Tax=Ferruginibacter sp. TaxID=1940288 RepID=UPI002658E161|nr:glycosyltransferase family 25 protein [Ferruginibacter sp.]MDB5279989.1 glycosyl transferase family 25 [Ferruginibacter sp.]
MIEEFGIESIYIVHAKKGYEFHEDRINKLFAKNGLSFEYVTDGDPSCFYQALLDKYFSADIKQVLSVGVLSCTLNHILSYERMVKCNNRFALVFENDPFFLGDFVQQIKKIAAEAASLPAGFIISLENTTLQFPAVKKLRKGQLLYPAIKGRCAGAYLLDLQAAKNMLKDLETHKCKQVIDWWHNTLIDTGVIKMYWADPPITEQGSHNGLLSAGISTKTKSTQRRIAWLAQKYYKSYVSRWFK